MIVLACETSTLLGSVAVFKDQKILSAVASQRQGSHSDVLNVFIERALSEAHIQLSDVDLFASGTGPGSFTGIRISLNTIKTFSYCHQKPCIGINSLLNLAYGAFKKTTQDLPVVTMINAYKNMVYAATYEKKQNALIELKKPSVVRVQNLVDYIERPCLVVGDGYTAYEKYFDDSLKNKIVRDLQALDQPTAQNLAFLADEQKVKSYHWSELLPIYLRASEAEENVLGIKYQPLI